MKTKIYASLIALMFVSTPSMLLAVNSASTHHQNPDIQKTSDHADQNQKHHKANKKDQTDQNQKHTSQAQKHASQNKGSKLIERVTKGRFEVTKRFQPPVENLNGYIVQSSRGQPQVLFTYKDQYIITGNIFTQNGANLSQHYKKKFIKSPLAKQAYNKLASRAWIEDGKDSAHHKLYVIVDPNCGYCHAMYEEIKNNDLISDGKLQIRWVPVGFLRGKDSQAKATAMLIDEKQAPKALRQDENAFKTGEMKPADLNSQNQMVQKAHKQVMKNTEFFRNNSFGGTPTLVYKTQSGEYNYIAGLVKGQKLQNLVNKLAGSW